MAEGTLTPDGVKRLNDAIFTMLEDPRVSGKVTTAMNEYTRFLMYHRFTGRPKRGFMHRIMPSQTLHPLGRWLSWGVPAELLDRVEFEGSVLYAFVYDGELFYEIAETKLAREDFERRLAARRVEKWEWYSRERLRRGILRAHKRSPHLKGEGQEAYAYNLMWQLVTRIVAHAQRNTDGEEGRSPEDASPAA